MPLGGCSLFPQPGFGASTGASGLRHNPPRGEAGSGCPRPPCRRPAMDACKSVRVEWPFPKAHPAVSGFRSLPSQQWNVHGIPHNSSSVCWQDWCGPVSVLQEEEKRHDWHPPGQPGSWKKRSHGCNSAHRSLTSFPQAVADTRCACWKTRFLLLPWGPHTHD